MSSTNTFISMVVLFLNIIEINTTLYIKLMINSHHFWLKLFQLVRKTLTKINGEDLGAIK